MNPFSDENLTRALRQATGSLPEPDISPNPGGGEDANHLKAELESLHNTPLGRVGRRLYRLMIKQWPKPDDSYDWVYEPGALELIPIERASISSVANKLSSSGAATAKISPLVGATVSDLASTDNGAAELTIVIGSQVREAESFQANNAQSKGEEIDEFVCHWQQESAVVELLDNNLAVPEKLIPELNVIKAVGSNYNVKVPARQAVWSLEYLGSKSIECESHALESPLMKRSSFTLIPFEKKLRWTNSSSSVSRRGVVCINEPFAGRFSREVDELFSSEQVDARVLFVEEAHRARITGVAEMELVLRTMNSALTTFQSRKTVGYTAIPKNPFYAAVDFVMGIFKPKEDESRTMKKYRDNGICEYELVEWRIDVDPSSEFALRGSAGHLRDYWFKLQNHQLSLKWQDKAEQRHPETIFLVGDAEPERAGMMMVTAFENAHVEQERAVRLIGSLKDFVERQARVH